jgi:hypothetical protein
MKCPKCGYTSFDYLDECKKCSTDLRDSRTLLQIIAVSPEDRAPTVPPTAPAPEAPASPTYGSEPKFASEPPPDDTSDLLQDLDFEESFEGLVERTSYEESPAEKTAEGEEDLLDLDFGDIFGEEGKKS